jgi:hypothetical protein
VAAVAAAAARRRFLPAAVASAARGQRFMAGGVKPYTPLQAAIDAVAKGSGRKFVERLLPPPTLLVPVPLARPASCGSVVSTSQGINVITEAFRVKGLETLRQTASCARAQHSCLHPRARAVWTRRSASTSIRARRTTRSEASPSCRTAWAIILTSPLYSDLNIK